MRCSGAAQGRLLESWTKNQTICINNNAIRGIVVNVHENAKYGTGTSKTFLLSCSRINCVENEFNSQNAF